MADVEPDVVVTQLFPPERASLIELLSSLDAGQWQAPTVCPGWSVKDVALHLLGDDIDLLSRRRDGVAPADTPSRPAGFQELVASLDRLNQTWVEATRRISPRLLCELLVVTGEATFRYLASLDLFAVEESVSWIRPEPVPNWLDVARQYTERWTHQQQIRDAVGVPGLKEPAFLAPVLATFVHALPRAFTGVPAAVGTTVEVVLAGEAGGRWVLTRTPRGWDWRQARRQHRGPGWRWTPRRRGGCGPSRSGRTRPRPPCRSRVIGRLAFRSWTPLPSSAKRAANSSVRNPEPGQRLRGHPGRAAGTGGPLNPGAAEANEALWRIVLVRMKPHPPTRAYVARRTAEGMSKREILRYLKRYVARQATATSSPRQASPQS